MSEVRDADHYVDSALAVLEWEEPTLLEWLAEDPHINGVLRANATAMFALIMADQKRKFTWERTIKRLEALVYRTSVAIAWNAAMHERRPLDFQ